jgi:hypothetical protein
LWDFAVEIRALREASLSKNDLRWLVCKGYVEPRVELHRPGDDQRQFRKAAALKFYRRSCFVLTPAGAALATRRDRTMDQRASVSPPAENSQYGAPDSQQPLPEWDPLRLELRVNRERARFEFLEPVILELKLKNVSSKPHILPDRILADSQHMTVIVKKKDRPARQFFPYAERCWQPTQLALLPEDAMYEALPVFAGKGGWVVSEPGDYTVQVALHRDGEDIVSNPLQLRILPPAARAEEVLAQDYFSDSVGRILAFGGSQFLDDGNAVLHHTIEEFADRRAAIHARLGIGNALSRDYKRLEVGDETYEELAPAHELKAKVRVTRADEDTARKELQTALVDSEETAAETLGHITLKNRSDEYSEWLAEQGERDDAADVQKCLLRVLSDRGVLARVLEEIEQRRDQYKRRPAAKPSRRVQKAT